MIRKLLLVVLLLVTVTIGTVQAQENRLRVVVSFSVLADVAQNVAGDAADVTSLIPAGADPHAYSPAPNDLMAVADADVVLINGAEFEQGLLKTIESVLGDKTPVVASSCVEILPFGDAELPPASTPDDDPLAQRCADNVSELDARSIAPPAYPVAPLGRLHTLACTSDGEEGNCDPHVWFNPYNVQLWTLFIRDTLSELDPANAGVYQQNAAEYIAQVEALKLEVSAQIAGLPEERRVLVTDHDALGYFAKTFGLRVVGLVVPSVSTVAEPSAAEIAQLIDTIRAQNVPAVFAGSTVSPALSQQVADESGAQFYTVYAEALTDGGDAPTYLDFLRYDVTTIVDALR